MTVFNGNSSLYPSYDGTSPSRSDVHTIRSPDAEDYEQIVTELLRHQELLVAQASTVVNSFSMVAAAGGSNVCEVTITAKDADGNTLAGVFNFDLWLSDAASGAGLTATTASGAVDVKTNSGAVLGTLTAKKALRVQTLATGVFVLSITDAAKTAFKVCAQAPGSGKTIVGVTLATGNFG